ncbi:MAG: metal-dependent hydrolase [Verrucomicrobia bacterium]|nr:metal-dependent hydrolase [Verrucomicrobiota bacterium]
MDPVSHVVLGASLAHAAFARRLGRAAAAAGGLAALLPDADIFIRSAQDPLVAIEYHRGFTHALIFVPLGAALVAGLWLLSPAWRRRDRWWPLWAAAALAYLSHTLLDAATSYGTQLLWPFSPHRSGWDLISIIDPIFTLVLAAGLILALRRCTLIPAGVGLGVAAVYLGCGAVQHGRALAAQRELAEARGHRIERCEMMPTMANNVVWRGLYVHEGRIYSDRIRVGWFSRPQTRGGWSLPATDAAALSPSEQARNHRRSFERFSWFSEGWVARHPADPTMLADMRYSLSAEAFDPIWGIRFTAPSAPTEVEWINRSRDRRVDVGDMWREITGRDERYGQ